jgi:hypothetical protein
MPTITSQGFAVRPHDPEGVWESNDGRYRGYARQLLAEHERLCTEVLKQWPTGAGSVISRPAQYPEIANLARSQSQTSDTTRIYASMAVEGYLNFYGVLRLGQQVFDDHFERMGLVPKLRVLLLVCDQLNVATNDPLVLLLEKVAQSRNSLVHPKTKEVVGDPATAKRTSLPMPETARLAVANMEAFFAAFIEAVPRAANHLNRLADA